MSDLANDRRHDEIAWLEIGESCRAILARHFNPIDEPDELELWGTVFPLSAERLVTELVLSLAYDYQSDSIPGERVSEILSRVWETAEGFMEPTIISDPTSEDLARINIGATLLVKWEQSEDSSLHKLGETLVIVDDYKGLDQMAEKEEWAGTLVGDTPETEGVYFRDSNIKAIVNNG